MATYFRVSLITVNHVGHIEAINWCSIPENESPFMAATLSQVCCHGAMKGGDTLEVLPFLKFVLLVESAWTICMIVRKGGAWALLQSLEGGGSILWWFEP